MARNRKFSLFSILIVDDDASQRKLLKKNFSEAFGFKDVFEAGNGKEALDVYEEKHPDIVMTDIVMPKINGLELIEKLKAKDPTLPIIVLTTHDMPEYILNALSLGVSKFILKPIEMSHIRLQLEKVVKQLCATLELERSRLILENYKKVIDVSNIVSITDEKGVITYVNDKFCEVSRYSRDELIGRSHNIVRHPESSASVFAEMWSEIKAGKMWHGVLKNMAKDGTTYIVDSTIAPIIEPETGSRSYLAIRHDLTDIFKKDEIIKQQSIDPLTNLGNRVRLINDVSNSKNPLLAIINIDEFSSINETFGNILGDKLLVEVSKRLAKLASKETILYRIYADEFALLVQDYDSNDDWREFLLNTIKDLSDESYVVDGQEIGLSFTSGVATHDGSIISRANIAYRYAKEHKDTIYFYNEELRAIDKKREENIKWNRELKRAIGEGDILTYFQPIYNAKTGRIDKYEALVRLRDQNAKIISPFFFLDVAKRSKLYGSITKQIVATTLAKSKESDADFSINISMLDLHNAETLSFICDALSKHDKCENIIFEITEQESLDYDVIKSFAKNVKAKHGCKIAIDDFGSGYSNFEHLVEIELDFIKIDGSIIKKIATSKESMILVKAIISFSHKLELKTVAEFVGDQLTFDTLKNADIDFMQGFYIGQPAETLQKDPLFK